MNKWNFHWKCMATQIVEYNVLSSARKRLDILLKQEVPRSIKVILAINISSFKEVCRWNGFVYWVKITNQARPAIRWVFSKYTEQFSYVWDVMCHMSVGSINVLNRCILKGDRYKMHCCKIAQAVMLEICQSFLWLRDYLEETSSRSIVRYPFGSTEWFQCEMPHLLWAVFYSSIRWMTVTFSFINDSNPLEP